MDWISPVSCCIGFFIGGFLGVLIMALMNISARSDEHDKAN